VRRAALAVGVLAGLAIAPEPARADFKEWTIAAMPAYALSYVDTRSASGGGAGLDVGFGVSESLTLHASGFVSWHSLPSVPMGARGGTMGAFAAMLGVSYAFDVIRLVPAFDVSAGVLGVRGGASFNDGTLLTPSTAFGVALGVTLDYLINRHVAVGIAVRYHAYITDLSRIPVYLFAGPRVLFRFGG
jgi:hypothetical protein